MRGWLAKLSRLLDAMASAVVEPASETTALSDREALYQRTRAYAHECGHAVVAWLSPAIVAVEGIIFRPDGSAYTAIVPARKHPDFQVEEAVICLGGLAGETMVWRRVSSGGFGKDLPVARASLDAFLATAAVSVLERRWEGRLAESSVDVASMFRLRPSPDLSTALNLCYRRAKWLLHENRAAFDRLVSLAMRQGNLSHEDIASQFGPRPWTPR